MKIRIQKIEMQKQEYKKYKYKNKDAIHRKTNIRMQKIEIQ